MTGNKQPLAESLKAGQAQGNPPSLRQVRTEFPEFDIWQEKVLDRLRFVAQARDLATSPYTVVTGDLAELWDALAGRPASWSGSGGPGQPPNIARVYSYLTAGKDHGAADRRAADLLLADFPEITAIAQANREFVTGAVARIAAQGIGAFIDIGAGLPSSLNVHQVVQQVTPSAVTCYVDCDEVVLAHARALLAAGPRVAVAEGDLRQPGAILAHPGLSAAVDLSQPVCVILASVLHFLPAEQADMAVATLKDAVAPGSYLVLSVGTSTGIDSLLLDRLAATYAGTSVIAPRTEGDIAGSSRGGT
jgi:hypothetical protein